MAAVKRARGSRKEASQKGAAPSSISAFAVSDEPAVAESVATLLLIERALKQGGLDVGGLGALLGRPDPVVILQAEARGFASSALRLLEGAAILPGRAQTVDVSYMRPDGHVRFSNEADIGWRIVTMLREAEGDDPEGEDERVLRARIANVARAGHPLLVLAETAALPPLLAMVADRVLQAGRLDHQIIAGTAARVGRHGPAAVEAAFSAHPFDPMHLSLADLSVAIRPGMALDRMVRALVHLAASGTEDTDPNGEDEGDGDGRGRPGDGWSKSQDARDGRSGSLSASDRDRQGKTRKERDRRGSERSSSAASSAGCDPVLPEAPNGYRHLDVETLAGYGAARGWALDLKADLTLWRAGALPWDQLSSRLLLSGPPGTGKTTFARALCNSLELPLYVTSVSTWLQASYLGAVIKQMSEAFDTARRNAPSILFIDECDGIGKRQPQDREFADYWNALVNKLLELMDGAARSEGVIIVGATNRPEAMDEALKRSGRWETQIDIPLPDREALAGILSHHLGEDAEAVVASAPGAARDPTGASVLDRTKVLDALARQAVGRSGADIERLVREARGRARREGRSLVHADLEESLAVGRPMRSRNLRYRMAVHEAGHALVRRALKLGTEIGLTIEAVSGGFAEAEIDLDVVQSPDWVMAIIAMHLAGRAAETVVFGNASIGSGGPPTSDLAKSTRLASSMELEFGFGSNLPLLYRSVKNAELLLLREDALKAAVHARLEAAFALAKRTIEADQASLLRLAEALAEAGSLNAAEIAAVFEAEEVSKSVHSDVEASGETDCPTASDAKGPGAAFNPSIIDPSADSSATVAATPSRDIDLA